MSAKLDAADLVQELRQFAFDLTFLAQEKLDLLGTLRAIAEEGRVGNQPVSVAVVHDLNECIETIMSSIEEFDERVEALARSLGLERLE